MLDAFAVDRIVTTPVVALIVAYVPPAVILQVTPFLLEFVGVYVIEGVNVVPE